MTESELGDNRRIKSLDNTTCSAELCSNTSSLSAVTASRGLMRNAAGNLFVQRPLLNVRIQIRKL